MVLRRRRRCSRRYGVRPADSCAAISEGSELFYVDTLNYPTPTIVKHQCPTAVTGLGGARGAIDVTCLDNLTERTYESALGTPSPITVPYRLIPRSAGHRGLFPLRDDGRLLDWMVCMNEADTVPTLTDEGFIVPPDRSAFSFRGYVTEVGVEIGLNRLVTGRLVIQRSGPLIFTPAGATAVTSHLLLEDGDDILLESGDFILLEA